MRRGACLAALLALTGCVATQRDVLELENQTDELKAQIIDLKKTIGSLQANQADVAVHMKQLHADLGVFTETAREFQTSLATLGSKIDDLGTNVSSVGSGISTKVSALGDSLTAQQQASQAQQTKALAEQKAALAAPSTSPTEIFHTAEVRLAKKSWDLAAQGFEDYLSRFPKGALADVAVYNLGEAHFGAKKWETAGRQFGTFLEKYPKSDLTASARLMYALCLVNLKTNITEARQYLDSIAVDFPKSPEAKVAAEHLKKLPAPRPPGRKTGRK